MDANIIYDHAIHILSQQCNCIVPPFDRSVHDVIVIILIYEYDKVRSVSTSEECQSSFVILSMTNYDNPHL